jgi:hypothetical protein
MRCLPLRRLFYERSAAEPLSSQQVSANPNCCRQGLDGDRIEDIFCWLIKLGVLRREVDGQGLTHRVRLTPMGCELLKQWPAEIPTAGLLIRMRHWFRRHRPRL